MSDVLSEIIWRFEINSDDELQNSLETAIVEHEESPGSDSALMIAGLTWLIEQREKDRIKKLQDEMPELPEMIEGICRGGPMDGEIMPIDDDESFSYVHPKSFAKDAEIKTATYLRVERSFGIFNWYEWKLEDK